MRFEKAIRWDMVQFRYTCYSIKNKKKYEMRFWETNTMLMKFWKNDIKIKLRRWWWVKKSALSEKVNCLLYTIRKICFIFTGMCATMVLKFNSEPQQISEYFQFQFNKTMLHSFLK